MSIGQYQQEAQVSSVLLQLNLSVLKVKLLTMNAVQGSCSVILFL